MTTWDLDWNQLTQEQKDHIKNVAYSWECDFPGQMALEFFNATIDVIKMRDRLVTEATLKQSVRSEAS